MDLPSFSLGKLDSYIAGAAQQRYVYMRRFVLKLRDGFSMRCLFQLLCRGHGRAFPLFDNQPADSRVVDRCLWGIRKGRGGLRDAACPDLWPHTLYRAGDCIGRTYPAHAGQQHDAIPAARPRGGMAINQVFPSILDCRGHYIGDRSTDGACGSR